MAHVTLECPTHGTFYTGPKRNAPRSCPRCGSAIRDITPPAPPRRRLTVGVDFDGVLHSYTSGWQGPGVILDPPVAGALDWVKALIADGIQVAVYSCRSGQEGGIAAMRLWCERHGFPVDRMLWPTHKPRAVLYVDDRGFHFTGANYPTPETVRRFVPWSKA